MPLNRLCQTFFFIVICCLSIFSQNPQGLTCLSDSLPKIQTGDANLAQGVFRTSAKWIPGQKVRVRFLDGDDFLKSKVKYYAQLWEQFANIDFVFVESGNAEIRVSFNTEKGASWSLVGKNSNEYSVVKAGNSTRTVTGNFGASMNFGWFNSNTNETEFRRTTLHEFGHALGLLHEHQNNNRNFEWNKPVVLNYYVNQLGWTPEKVENALFKRYGTGTEYSNKEYDRMSIMHYSVDPSFTKNGAAVGNNTQLSSGDKAIIAEMYPFNNVANKTEFTYKNITADFNVFNDDDEKGMNILLDFQINNALNQENMVAVYFYKNDGTALVDTNKSFYSTNGKVVAIRKFKPNFQRAVFTKFKVFMPYSELELKCGDYRLKYSITIWNGTKNIATSGYSYFTFRQPCE